MTIKTLHILFILFLVPGIASKLNAQGTPNPNWDAKKIKGVRHIPYSSYSGSPFLNETWFPGKLEFSDGEIADSLHFRYSSFKDELLYYNQTIATQIVIDKTSLNGFSFIDNEGKIRYFRRQYYDGFMKGERFFEVLSHGQTALLCYRKVNLNPATPYKDVNGVLRNMIYETSYQYYFYSPAKGYTPVRTNQSSLMSKFEKNVQKTIKKVLRKNKLRVTDEDSFIQAWEILKNEGYPVIF